jgi:cyclophilin family peptidyl-prolyl cis-trans isomerase
VPNQKRARQKAARAQKLEEQRRLARRNSMIKRTVIVVIVAGAVIGSAAAIFAGGGRAATTTSTTSAIENTQNHANAAAITAGCPANPLTTVNKLHWSKLPKMTINAKKLYYATFDTTAGTFVAELDPAEAPVTVNSFVFLAQHKYFNCNSFFRTVQTFVIQSGAPEQNNGDSTQPGYTLPDEFQKHPGTPTFPLDSLVMANEGSTHPNSGGSQFFIVTGTAGETLGNSYTLFGKVISGLNIPIVISDFGDTLAQDNSGSGYGPQVIERILKVTISTKAP